MRNSYKLKLDFIIQSIIVAVFVSSLLAAMGVFIFSLATGAMLLLPTVMLYMGFIYGTNKLVSAVRREAV